MPYHSVENEFAEITVYDSKNEIIYKSLNIDEIPLHEFIKNIRNGMYIDNDGYPEQNYDIFSKYLQTF